jgi:hypothetical protein
MRLSILSRCGLIWTFARLVWGLIALTSVLQGWLTKASRSEAFYSVILVIYLLFDLFSNYFILYYYDIVGFYFSTL